MRMRIEAFLALSKRLNRNLMHPFRQHGEQLANFLWIVDSIS